VQIAKYTSTRLFDLVQSALPAHEQDSIIVFTRLTVVGAVAQIFYDEKAAQRS